MGTDMVKLVVVFSSHDLDTEEHTGVAGNAPEERKRLVQRALRDYADTAFFQVSRPEPSIYELGSLVHGQELLRYLSTAWDRWTEEWLSPHTANEHHLGTFCSAQSDPKSPTPPLFCAAFFAPRHESSTQCGDSVFSQACYFAMDKETPISGSTLLALQWDLAVTREAVRQLDIFSVAYSQITHPGHHAFANSYGGFCFLNHAAIAVKLMQQRGFKRIAVVDVDFHCGNGTSSIFTDDPTVFFASLHADPNQDYPFNFFPKPSDHQLHLILPKHGCKWKDYAALLQQVVEAVHKFNPDAMVVSLGVDTLRGDPVALPTTRCALAPEDYAEMGKVLLADPRLVHLPTLVVQEGGYKLDEVHLAVAAFLSAAEFKVKRNKL